MRKSVVCLSLIVLLGWGGAHARQLDTTAMMAQARADIAILCSDSLQGRGYQQQGHLKAARYIASRFAQLDLAPVAPNRPEDPYLQFFSFQLNQIDNASLAFGKRQLKPGFQFLPHPATAASPQRKLPVVDLRHGTPADWDEAARNPAARGALLLIREGWPQNAPWPDSIRKQYKQLAQQLKMTRALGAAGVLFAVNKLTCSFSAVQADLLLLEVLASDLPRRPRQAQVEVQAGMRRIYSQNVVGWLPGEQATDSAIVVCAHYDHMGRLGDAIFRGANDNASGVAWLLALAKRLRDEGGLRIPVVFVAFGAEETGLNGSSFYAGRPAPMPLRSIPFVFNIDLMGFGEKGVMAVGGATYPAIYEPLLALNDSLKLLPALRKRPNAPNSDHWPFTQLGVPALFFYAEGGAPYYHDVHDNPAGLSLQAFPRLQELVIRYFRTRFEKSSTN